MSINSLCDSRLGGSSCLDTDLNEDGKPYSQWCDLPNLILEKVFALLNIGERYAASQVCRNWYLAFYLPKTWSIFVLTDTTLTRRKYNYYSGWQHILDHVRLSQCLSRVGMNFRCLIFESMLNFYNLFEFMNMMSYFTEQQGLDNTTVKGVGCRVHTLRFTFPCDMASDQRERCRLYGTGGKLLEALKRLMGNLVSLRFLELRDLMLDVTEGLTLLDEVCATCSLTLEKLILINATEATCQLLHVGVFLNLQVLVISPQNLGEDVLVLLGQTRLRHLHIFQNRFTPSELVLQPVARRAWQGCRKSNPGLSVHLCVESRREREIVWQDGAPVRSVIYSSPHIKVYSEAIMTVIDMYASDLRAYGHLGLPRFFRSSSFHERVDALLLLLVRQAVWLHTLIVRERISTATILLLAKTGCNLKNLIVRRNAVILRCDWPKSPDWEDEFFIWLQKSSRSYESTEKEVSQLLGCKWSMLTDKQFKAVSVDLHHLF